MTVAIVENQTYNRSNFGYQDALSSEWRDMVANWKSALINTGLLVFGTAFIAWLGWLSISIISVKETGALTSEIVTRVEERVNRISRQLPTSIALHTQELIMAPVGTAFLLSEPWYKEDVWKRGIVIYDGEKGIAKTGLIDIRNPADMNDISQALWGTYSGKYNAVSVGEIIEYSNKYNVKLGLVPDNIDYENSIVVNATYSESGPRFENRLIIHDVKMKNLKPSMNFEELIGALGIEKIVPYE